MAKPPKSRLDKTLPKVEEWAKDNWPPYGWLDEYLSGEGDVALSGADLFKHGMDLCSQSLLNVKQNQFSDAITNMASGFTRRAISKAISIERLKGTDDVAIGDLDGFTDLMLGAIALGRPDAAKALYSTVLSGLEGGYGVNDGHNPDIGTTLRYAAFGLSIISNWLGQPLDLGVSVFLCLRH